MLSSPDIAPINHTHHRLSKTVLRYFGNILVTEYGYNTAHCLSFFFSIWWLCQYDGFKSLCPACLIQRCSVAFVLHRRTVGDRGAVWSTPLEPLNINPVCLFVCLFVFVILSKLNRHVFNLIIFIFTFFFFLASNWFCFALASKGIERTYTFEPDCCRLFWTLPILVNCEMLYP